MKYRRGRNIRRIIFSFLIIFILLALSAIIYSATIEKTEITFQDNNLYQAVKNVLSKDIMSSDNGTKTITIATETLNGITSMDLRNSDISNLSGIEKFTNLSSIDLSRNNISDISPIISLNNLTNLNLNDNPVSNLSELSNKTNLTDLYLSNTGISNVSFLSNLVNLKTLDISSNNISNLQGLSLLNSLITLNVSSNRSLATLGEISTHDSIEDLNISSTGITDISSIINLGNLKRLNIGNLTGINVNPVLQTHKVGSETVPYLANLEMLDMRYTNRISFSSLAKLTKIKELYMQGNSISSISGIYEMSNLQYLNLEDNNISDLSYFIKWKTVDNTQVVDKYMPATEISLKNNEISDVSIFADLPQQVEYLDLSQNHIYNITPLTGTTYSKGIYLQDQTIDFPIFKKSAEVNQYIILPSIFQLSKTNGSIVYSENASFDVNGVTLNNASEYQTPGNYNVIIDYNKTSADTLSLTLHGGNADGSIINFKISSSSSAIDSLLFVDENLDAAIYRHLLTLLDDDTYIARIPKIINIEHSIIREVEELNLSNGNIRDLTGLASFSELENLNLAQNKITTIDELKSCTKITNLNLSNSPVGDNNSAILQMTKLQSLDLSNTGITNINIINDLVNYWISEKDDIELIELNISNNGLTDDKVEGIKNITPLQKLYVAGNNITDISGYTNLTSLNTLDISSNQIEDISALSNLKALRTLYMNNNKIYNVEPISRLSVTVLEFSGNKVSDVSSMSRMTSLTDLYMDNNMIDDISSLEILNIKNVFSAKRQKMVRTAAESAQGEMTVELPAIFKSSKQNGSKVYTASDFNLSNCTLSPDGNSIVVNLTTLGDKIATATIAGGNADGTMLSVAKPLEATIDYNIKEKTNQNVIATISFNRANVTITNNSGNNTYTFTQNDEFTFEYMDEYGFTGQALATVNWIDKDAPQYTISKQQDGNKVIVTITMNEEVEKPSGWGWNLSEDKKVLTKTFNAGDQETITVSDLAGNEIQISITAEADTTPPTISNVENNKVYDGPVTPTITDENLKEVILTKDGQQVINYRNGNTISGNGKYVLTARDEFGNETTVSFEIRTASDVVTSSKYRVSEDTLYISRISPKTSVSTLKNNLDCELQYDVINKNGNKMSTSTTVSTGDKIRLSNNKEYILIVTGDTDGNGDADFQDILNINKYRLNGNGLQGAYLIAGDVNDNGNADFQDILEINKYRLGNTSTL